MEAGNYRVRLSIDSFVHNARKFKLFVQRALCFSCDFHKNTYYLYVNQEADVGEAAWICVIGNEFSNIALKIFEGSLGPRNERDGQLLPVNKEELIRSRTGL